MSRHLGNEYDENFLEKFENINIKIELFDRNVDDQDIALRSFGKRVKFCHLDGELIPKTDVEIEDQKELQEDQVVMEELRKVADSVIDMFKTEEDSPGNHHELGYKVPILDLALWVESVKLPAPGMVLVTSACPLVSTYVKWKLNQVIPMGWKRQQIRERSSRYFLSFIPSLQNQRGQS